MLARIHSAATLGLDARILDVEAKHLTHSAELLAALRKCVGAIGA